MPSSGKKDPADVEAIFALFDGDGDGLLSKDEYVSFMHGIRFWNSGRVRTDEKWAEHCKSNNQSLTGLSREDLRKLSYHDCQGSRDAANDLAQSRCLKVNSCRRKWS